MVERPPGLDELVGDAFRAASLAGADMHLAADDLEALKRRLAGEEDALAAWHAVNAVIARRYPDMSLALPLAALRDGVLALMLDTARRAIDDRAKSDPAGAATEWVRRLGAAAAELWSDTLPVIGAWAEDRAFLDDDLGRLAVETGRLIDVARFPDGRGFLKRLAADGRLTERVRAALLVLVGQIEIFRVEDLATAQRLHAESLTFDSYKPGLLAADIATKRIDWAIEADRVARLQEAEDLVEAAMEAAATREEPDAGLYTRRADLHVKRAELAVAAHDQAQADDAYAAAMADSRTAVERVPWDADAHCSLAAFLIRRGDGTGEAEHRAGLARLLEPADAADTDAVVGAALLEVGRLDDARAAYQRAITPEPDNLDVIIGYSALLQATGDIAESEAVLRAAEERHPGTFELARARAWLAEEQAAWTDALDRHREALARRPEAEAAVRADLAWALAQLGDGDGATAEADAACAVLASSITPEGPALVPATSRLLDAVDRLAEAGRTDDALARLDVVRALRGASFEAEYHNRRGVVSHDVKRFDDAVAEYRQAIAADPSTMQYHANLALSMRILGRYDEAVSAIEAGHAVNGDDTARDSELALVWNDRGNDAFSRSEYDDAAGYYRRAVALSPSDPVLVANLAGALDGTLATGGSEQIEATLGEIAELYARADSLHDGSVYTAIAQATRQRLDLVRTFGTFVVGIAPFARVRVRLATDVVPVFVDDQHVLKSAITERLDTGRAHLGPYGLARSGVRFDVDELRPSGTAAVMLNGRARVEVPVHDDAESVLDAVEDLLLAEPAALVGPDDVVGLLGDVEGVDASAIVDDPETLARVTRVLRDRADEDVDVRSAVLAALEGKRSAEAAAPS